MSNFNFDKLKFYYGTKEHYEMIDNNALDNCFYYVYEEKEGEKTRTYLYLRDELIYDSKEIEGIVDSVLTSESFQNKLNEYLSLQDNNNQIIQSNITINKDLVVKGGVDIKGNIKASNFIYDANTDTITIPADLILQGVITFNNSDNQYRGKINDSEILNSRLSNISSLNFGENATIENLPTYNKGEYVYDFEKGNFKVNIIEAKQIIGPVGDKVTSMELESLRIGNLVLQEDNGNLKITSVTE